MNDKYFLYDEEDECITFRKISNVRRHRLITFVNPIKMLKNINGLFVYSYDSYRHSRRMYYFKDAKNNDLMRPTLWMRSIDLPGIYQYSVDIDFDNIRSCTSSWRSHRCRYYNEDR